jgi:hypothetical protein
MRRVLINGAAGLVSTRAGKPFSLGSFTIKDEKIVEIDILPDAERICRPDLAFSTDKQGGMALWRRLWWKTSGSGEKPGDARSDERRERGTRGRA